MTEWSGVVETQYGTINLAEPNLPPAEVDFDRFWEEKCATLGGGIQVSLPEQNGDVPIEVRVLDESAPIEDYWDHVAEVGLHAPGGRLQVFSWMADVDLAAELDVPTEPLVARIHWTGMGAWLDHVEANRYEESAALVRLRVDLVPGTLDAVRTLKTWERWAPPVHESRRANGLRVFRGVAAGRRVATLEPERRSFWSPYPTTEEGTVSALYRDPADGSRWAHGNGGSWSYQFLQELSPDEATALEAASFWQGYTYARDAEGRIWSAFQMPLERVPALAYIRPDHWQTLLATFEGQTTGVLDYQVVDLPPGWSRITRRRVDETGPAELVDEVDDATDAFYQRWRDGAEIPS
jgi:hypothetical protein